MKIIGSSQTEEEMKTKKMIKIIVILLSILFVICIGLVVVIVIAQQGAFKLKIDGTQISKYNEDTFVFEDDKLYIAIKDFATLVNYNVYNGGYQQYTEDTTKCYIENSNEVASFEEGSNKIYKTPPQTQADYEYFTLEEPVKAINGKLYTTPEGISIGCNVVISYNSNTNTVTVNTISNVVASYQATYANTALTTHFSNQKALLYNLLVVNNYDGVTKLNSKNVRYGIADGSGNEIVGKKYTDIEFIESTNEFLVTTEEGKVGIITSTGETKVAPQYDSLKQIDKDLNLYLATSGGKQGVIEKNGKILIYLEYDKIGIDTTSYSSSGVKSQYLLLGKCIPVQQNGYWGLYDTNGNLILPIEYTGFGAANKESTKNNVLVIDEVDGIIVYKYDRETKTGLYGIVNTKGKSLVPVRLSSVYSITSGGQEIYYMEYNSNTYDIIDYIERYSNNISTTNNTTVMMEEQIGRQIEENSNVKLPTTSM